MWRTRKTRESQQMESLGSLALFLAFLLRDLCWSIWEFKPWYVNVLRIPIHFNQELGQVLFKLRELSQCFVEYNWSINSCFMKKCVSVTINRWTNRWKKKQKTKHDSKLLKLQEWEVKTALSFESSSYLFSSLQRGNSSKFRILYTFWYLIVMILILCQSIP